MYYPHRPQQIDDDPPPMPAATSGLRPTQRPPAEPGALGQATAEVSVVTLPGDGDDTHEEPGAVDAGADADAWVDEALDEADDEEVQGEQAQGEQAQGEEAPVVATDDVAEVAPWADLTEPEAEADAYAEETPTVEEEETDVPVSVEEGAETAAQESSEPATPLRPGDVAQAPIVVWSEQEVQRLRSELRELQVLFIDEPDTAVAGAKRLVTEAVQTLAETLLAEQDQLDPRHRSDTPDTEAMRVAMRQYREFLERVLAL